MCRLLTHSERTPWLSLQRLGDTRVWLALHILFRLHALLVPVFTCLILWLEKSAPNRNMTESDVRTASQTCVQLFHKPRWGESCE